MGRAPSGRCAAIIKAHRGLDKIQQRLIRTGTAARIGGLLRNSACALCLLRGPASFHSGGLSTHAISTPMSPTCEPPSRLVLHAGQRVSLHLSAGSHLSLLEGRLQLSEPLQWIAERCVALRIALAAGGGHNLPRDGTVELLAHTDAVCLVMPGSRPARRPWRAMLQPA
ncbi:hypothetical protein [Ideonella sp. BN130291]|uniref:hypothetical protein n=1 Tax=Ideonella sp. BN130291 TaxID=3112940 RepID=UPI002E25DFE1|nr:hypothetical protein [Ideonella sp. BN130291]